MHIAGGVYRELCSVPVWNTLFGSGGRAAAALSGLTSEVTLYTYLAEEELNSLKHIENMGVCLNLVTRLCPIAFSYFHPLSTPCIQPERSSLVEHPLIEVVGDAVLRFGFLEGSAKVQGERVVFDPQTWQNQESYYSNGSTAKELAIVLNELELLHKGYGNNVHETAQKVLREERASIVIVKQGPVGSTVFEDNGNVSFIPAYESELVFKLGTGDVFSALFAFYWAKMKLPPVVAADKASRAVSIYSENRLFSFSQSQLEQREPLKTRLSRSVCVEGSLDTIGQRYVLEEIKFLLNELGQKAYCPVLDLDKHIDIRPDVVLVVNDNLTSGQIRKVNDFCHSGSKIVVLDERGLGLDIDYNYDKLTTDLTTSIYSTFWV
ncbi:hypothetical protein NDJ01_18095 [Vibrio sp. HS-50-1]|uniref:PfkB family carbohydrate kinase n=1 Tax=Vibrio sp. HS-50-1 TaxID=2945079 RepID=UPI00215F85AE|nr:hypothetical protein [Vibrio sp. HS-50-1]MCS0206109.1 hypothetical protein [Vibrio sp. HS-50-1]